VLEAGSGKLKPKGLGASLTVYLGECSMFIQRGKLDNGHRHFVFQAEQFGAGEPIKFQRCVSVAPPAR
jgi:hypothetical protein